MFLCATHSKQRYVHISPATTASPIHINRSPHFHTRPRRLRPPTTAHCSGRLHPYPSGCAIARHPSPVRTIPRVTAVRLNLHFPHHCRTGWRSSAALKMRPEVDRGESWAACRSWTRWTMMRTVRTGRRKELSARSARWPSSRGRSRRRASMEFPAYRTPSVSAMGNSSKKR